MHKKIVIRPPGNVKDLVASFPYIEKIISHFRESTIEILAEKKLYGLFDHLELHEELYFEKKPRFAPILEDGEDVISHIQRKEYDLAIVFPESFSSAYLFYQGMVKNVVGFERTFGNFLLTNKVSGNSYDRLLSALDIPTISAAPTIRKKKTQKTKLQIGVDATLDERYFTLRWYGDFIALLVEELPCIEIEIIGQENMLQMRRKDDDPISFCTEKVSLHDYLQKINNFDVFISKNEGLLALAQSLQTPCVDISLSETKRKLFPEDVLTKLRKAILEPLKRKSSMKSLGNFVSIQEPSKVTKKTNIQHLNVGVIVLAGGKGRRLGLDVPKGLLQIGEEHLFDIILNKAKAAKKVGILTSPVTYKETKEFFSGREVDFFEKRVYPTEDGDGVSPEGNGAIFESVVNSPVWDEWKDLDLISVVAVDNPLADAMDSELLSTDKELAVIAVKRAKEEKRLGVLCKDKNALVVKEYFSLGKDGFEGLGYSGSFVAKPSFFKKVASKDLPFYRVEKKDAVFYERLVIDGFAFAEDFDVIEKQRDTHFFPIKEKRDLLAYKRKETTRSYL